MTGAALMAATAAACGVAGVWDLLAAGEQTRFVRWAGEMGERLRRAGREERAVEAAERRRLTLVTALACLALAWLMIGLAAGVASAAIAPFALRSLIAARRRRRGAALAGGAPALARSLADAVAAGHAVRGAVQAAALGQPSGPAGERLRSAAAALDRGATTEDALRVLRGGGEARALDVLVTALLLQRRAGGDLAGLLRTLGDALAESARAAADARSATVQARFTGLLVAALPLLALGLAELASPGYLAKLLGNPLSAWLTICAVGLQLAALAAMRRLGRAA